MPHINIEIKARSTNQEFVREFLKSHNADFKGIDHQIDTYFKVNNGRLKIREGNIENYLIYYKREDQVGSKQSDITLCKSDHRETLKDALTKALGILVIVDKKREIYRIDNIKFHIDVVEELGTFIEIEAQDVDGTLGKKKIQEQADTYMKELNIAKEDLISVSYSDLLLEKQGKESSI